MIPRLVVSVDERAGQAARSGQHGLVPVAGVAPSSDSHSDLPMRAARVRVPAAIMQRYPVVGSPQVSCTPRTLTARPKDGSVTMPVATACQASSG